MAFDKTGTITRGEFAVTEFRSLIDGLSLNTLLYWVSSIESKSGHPMAAALIDYAELNSVDPKPDRVEQFQNFPGEGIYGNIDGMEIYVGNRKISSRAGCTTEIEGDSLQGNSVGYIFLGSSPAGIFSLSDVCRTGVKDAMRELKQMGIKTVMLTGDCYAAANHVHDQLGGALDEFQAELLPEDKATIIKGFQKEAPTAMMGDGLNDAPALATADIGISMGISGSALAKETGHVILMTNDIGRIPKAARLARRVRRKIIENMVISIGTKGAIVALAIAGYPLVWAAVLADAGTCLLVILNSMLLLRGTTHRHGKKGCKSSHAHHHKYKASCCKSENDPQLCCSNIESQKKCTRQSCSSEGCQSDPSGSKSCGSNQCSDSTQNNGRHSHPHSQCCSAKISSTACQSAVSESKSCGSNNCSDSIHKSSFHSLTNSLICSSEMFDPQCHSATSSSKCGSTKCSDFTDKNSWQSHKIPQTCSTKKSVPGCQSAVSGPKSCGNSKCSEPRDNNTHHSHHDHQTCTSKMCAPQSPSATSSSKTCGNTKCSDTTSKNSCHSHAKSEPCSSKMSGPSCQNANSERILEQESLDLVQKDMEPNHDHTHGCSDEEHDHHPNLDKAYDSCALQECCYSVQGNITEISETGIQETAHCDSTNQTCQTAISGSMTCGINKCVDSLDIHGCHSHAHPPHKEHNLEEESLNKVGEYLNPYHAVGHGCSDKEHDHSHHAVGHGCSDKEHDHSHHAVGSDKEHDHSHPEKAYDSCATEECCFSVQDHGICDVSESGIQETANCDSTKQNLVIPNSCKHSPQDQVNHCGFHSRTTPTNEELTKLVMRSCKYTPCHVRSGSKKHATECGPIVRSTINILRDNHHHHHLDCSGRKVCSPLEKRHINGCCESFRKECCPKNNHFASSFGGGLSEIVIE